MRLRNVKDANNILINSGLLVEANPFNEEVMYWDWYW